MYDFLDRLKYAGECAEAAGKIGASLGGSIVGAVSSVGCTILGPKGTVCGMALGTGAGALIGSAIGGVVGFVGGVFTYI